MLTVSNLSLPCSLIYTLLRIFFVQLGGREGWWPPRAMVPPRMNTCAHNTLNIHTCIPLLMWHHVTLPFAIPLGDYFLTNSLRSTSRKYISHLHCSCSHTTLYFVYPWGVQPHARDILTTTSYFLVRCAATCTGHQLWFKLRHKHVHSIYKNYHHY